ncbi:Neurotransmitter-gated ion-channel ligand binding domain protein, partial [Teladorsagia circumcincta]
MHTKSLVGSIRIRARFKVRVGRLKVQGRLRCPRRLQNTTPSKGASSSGRSSVNLHPGADTQFLQSVTLRIASKPVDKGEVDEPLQKFTNNFMASAREQLEDGEDENVFKTLWYDPNYKVHDLCEKSNSGGQTGELIWTEPGDRLLKVIGNGVVKDGYNMFLAPGQAQGRRTDVHVAVYIESMSSFKAQTMDFEVDMYLAMGWFDRRLAHNCTHPILVTSKLIADRMWHPDLYFVNSKFAYLQEVTTPNLMVIVYPDGLIFKSMRLDVTLSCMMDLKLFPIDHQECPLKIQSYAYIEQIVNLTWHVAPPYFPVGSNEEIKLNDMAITRTRYEKCAGPYPMFRGSGKSTTIPLNSWNFPSLSLISEFLKRRSSRWLDIIIGLMRASKAMKLIILYHTKTKVIRRFRSKQIHKKVLQGRQGFFHRKDYSCREMEQKGNSHLESAFRCGDANSITCIADLIDESTSSTLKLHEEKAMMTAWPYALLNSQLFKSARNNCIEKEFQKVMKCTDVCKTCDHIIQ